MVDTNFRLSYWHMEIAKLIGEGLPNRDIKKMITISDSRLSVLRANPLIKRAAERYRKMNEDKYKKALDCFADNAEDVAKEVVRLVTSPLISAGDKLKAAEMVLEHASHTSPEGQPKGNEIVFEQMLRVTKRGSGDYGDSEVPYDADPHREQLLLDAHTGPDFEDSQDAEVVESDTPKESTFTGPSWVLET